MSNLIDEQIKQEIIVQQREFWIRILAVIRVIILFMVIFVVGWTFYAVAKDFLHGLIIYTAAIFGGTICVTGLYFLVNYLIAKRFIKKLDK